MRYDVKQFKLTSGEEIICEVIEWPEEDDEGKWSDMVVRNVYKIVALDQNTSGARYYTFRPWMIYQEGEDVFQTLNWEHIIGEGNPTEKLLEQYFMSIKGESPDEEEAKREIQKRLEDYIENLRNMVQGQQVAGDSDSDPKVIKFPTGRTYH